MKCLMRRHRPVRGVFLTDENALKSCANLPLKRSRFTSHELQVTGYEDGLVIFVTFVTKKIRVSFGFRENKTVNCSYNLRVYFFTKIAPNTKEHHAS